MASPRPSSGLSTRPAGGKGHTDTIDDVCASMLHGGDAPRKSSPERVPVHLQSAFSGAGVLDGAVVPPSPRYMRPTTASTASARVPPGSAGPPPAPAAAPSEPPRDTRFDRAEFGPKADKFEVSTMDVAGGDANDAMKSQIDFVPRGETRRPLRRPLAPPARQAPATTAGIASPSRQSTLESPRDAADRMLAESGIFMAGGDGPIPDISDGPIPMPGAETAVQWRNADARAGGRLAAPYFSTHDKSVPNARRSQRGTGACLPGPVTARPTHEPNSNAPRAFLTDAGFASTAMHRRGRGSATPGLALPTSNPNDGGGIAAVVGGYGMTSGGSQVDPLLGGRRARGQCSPRVSNCSSDFMTWGA